MTDTPSATQPKWDIGLFAGFGCLVGIGCLIFALAGVVNTFFEWDIALRISGARVDLPNNYEASLGLVAGGIGFIALSLFGSYVMHRFKLAKGKPLVRIAIVLLSAVFLVAVGRGVQIAALTASYGSMLAYYCTDGDLDDVKAELAKKPDRETLDRSVGRAAQYDNAPALKLLLEAGADLKAKSRPKAQRRCALVGAGPKFTKVALDSGVKPKTCPNSKALIWEAIRHGSTNTDKATAKTVTMLAKAGWSPKNAPKDQKQSPLEFAQEKKMKTTVKAIEAALK